MIAVISRNACSSPKRSTVQKSMVEGVLILARIQLFSQMHTVHTRTLNRRISNIIKAKRVILQTGSHTKAGISEMLWDITFLFCEIISSITKCTREILSRTSTQQYNLRVFRKTETVI